MEATEAQLQDIKNVIESTKDLGHGDYFKYRSDYKKDVLNIEVIYPAGKSDLNDMVTSDKSSQLHKLKEAGQEIQSFLEKHPENQYLLIIEGQASKDNYLFNYELSYQRALGLMRYWIEGSGITFGRNCEIIISGSGDGKLDTHSMREIDNETKNQRFLIHILPKNIIESSK